MHPSSPPPGPWNELTNQQQLLQIEKKHGSMKFSKKKALTINKQHSQTLANTLAWSYPKNELTICKNKSQQQTFHKVWHQMKTTSGHLDSLQDITNPCVRISMLWLAVRSGVTTHDLPSLFCKQLLVRTGLSLAQWTTWTVSAHVCRIIKSIKKLYTLKKSKIFFIFFQKKFFEKNSFLKISAFLKAI
jgi:hypothetical protein